MSCVSKSIVYFSVMQIIKKIIYGIFFLSFLSNCIQTTALIGPVYTLGSTGNIYQAGLSFGSNKAITSKTGKAIQKNVKNKLKIKKDDTDFEKLVKKRIKETRKKLNFDK